MSTEQAKDVRLYHSLRSRLLYARRHWPRWQVPVLGALTLAIELPARMLLALVRADWADLSAAASAYGRLASDLRRARAGRASMT